METAVARGKHPRNDRLLCIVIVFKIEATNSIDARAAAEREVEQHEMADLDGVLTPGSTDCNLEMDAGVPTEARRIARKARDSHCHFPLHRTTASIVFTWLDCMPRCSGRNARYVSPWNIKRERIFFGGVASQWPWTEETGGNRIGRLKRKLGFSRICLPRFSSYRNTSFFHALSRTLSL